MSTDSREPQHQHCCAPSSSNPIPLHARITPAQNFDGKRFELAIRELVSACGIEAEGAPMSAHMGKTPERVRLLWQERLLGGYRETPADILGTGFADPSTDMVLIRGVAVHGVCPHHLLPFRGVAHVAYIPNGRLHGFGRIARLVDTLAHRFTYQEWLTRDIVDALMEYGAAAGAACVVEAEQLCLLLGEDRRGDERVRTQAFTGAFTEPHLRAEFLQGIRNT